jgi:2'-5' RNA ligase
VESIVTAFDKPWRERLDEIWGELKAVIADLKGAAVETRPHFTYQGADSYDSVRVSNALAGIAAGSTAFEVETAGVELFHGDDGIVVYLAITPNDALRAMHRRIWDATQRIAEARKPVYAEATWVPHITIASGALGDEQVPLVQELLGRKEYRWTMPVGNVCYVPDTSDAGGDWYRFNFG